MIWDYLLSLPLFNVLAIATYLVISIYSVVAYKFDSNQGLNQNKSIQIDGLPFAKQIIIYTRYSTMLFSFTALLTQSSFFLLLPGSRAVQIFGLLLSICGVIIFNMGKSHLGINYTPCYNSYLPNQLVKKGIYQFIRHPIYTGNILIILGAILATKSALIIPGWLALTWIYYKSAKCEENFLIRRFPEYKEYQVNTGRFLPKLNPNR